MIEIKLGIMAICSALFWWGGYSWHNARRFIMPSLLTASSMLIVVHKDLWILAMLSCMGVFCLGYGDKSPLRHCFGNGWGRGVWGILAAICLSLPLFLTHHLTITFLHLSTILGSSTALVAMGIYLSLNFTLENALKNIPQWLGDPLIGLGFSVIIILIK